MMPEMPKGDCGRSLASAGEARPVRCERADARQATTIHPPENTCRERPSWPLRGLRPVTARAQRQLLIASRNTFPVVVVQLPGKTGRTWGTGHVATLGHQPQRLARRKEVRRSPRLQLDRDRFAQRNCQKFRIGPRCLRSHEIYEGGRLLWLLRRDVHVYRRNPIQVSAIEPVVVVPVGSHDQPATGKFDDVEITIEHRIGCVAGDFPGLATVGDTQRNMDFGRAPAAAVGNTKCKPVPQEANRCTGPW